MIHQTAIIHPTAQVHPSAEIGPYAVIGESCVIAAGVNVGSHAVVDHAEIGENTVIFNHASVGQAPQDLKYKGEPTKLIMGRNCQVREFTTLNRGTIASGKTVIGDNCLFMAYTHVAHDCVLGNGIIMANAATLGGHVHVDDNAFLGGIVAVHQFTRIGKLAMLAGGSMVSQDVLPFCQVHGNRARLVGLNLVGLKRRGLTLSMVEEIKSAYRTLFLSTLPMEEALDQLEAASPGPYVREMIDFIHSSKRGIARPAKKETEEDM